MKIIVTQGDIDNHYNDLLALYFFDHKKNVVAFNNFLVYQEDAIEKCEDMLFRFLRTFER